jgi:alcohol dehydrogenase
MTDPNRRIWIKEDDMKALAYDGPGQIAHRDHPMPTLRADTDIIMRISHSTICGTDAHIIKGGVPTVQPGTVLGTRPPE